MEIEIFTSLLEQKTGDGRMLIIEQILQQLQNQSDQLAHIQKSLLANKEILTRDEFLVYTGYSDNYAYKLTAGHKIVFYKPNGKHIFFKRLEVDEWLTRNRQKTNDEIADTATAYIMKSPKGGKNAK